MAEPDISRLEVFLRGVDKDYNDYRGDPEMHDDRINMYCSWLHEIQTSMKELSEKMGEEEFLVLLEVAESLYPEKYFAFGTHYGTGHGIRPVLEIVRCLKQNQDILEREEMRIAYLRKLQKIYSDTMVPVDPKWHYREDDNKMNEEIANLNQRLKNASLEQRVTQLFL